MKLKKNKLFFTMTLFLIGLFGSMNQGYSVEIIDGNQIAQIIINELKNKIANTENDIPTVAFLRIGDDPASISYLRKKQLIAKEIGIRCILKTLPINICQEELLAEIDSLNVDPDIHGILVQLPLPDHINNNEVFNRISLEKDVDGLHVINLGKLFQEDSSGLVPCTPAGICELLKRTMISTEGKHIVILNRSILVGKPLLHLMLKKSISGNATITICHSKTEKLDSILKQADILIVAIGKAEFITGEMLKKDVIIIDVGCNRIEDLSQKSGYRIVGDVNFNSIEHVASKITPVPGGVGPMTVAMLMKNVIKAFEEQPHKKICKFKK